MNDSQTASRTFAQRLTPRGRGAVATILVTGELEPVNCYFRATNQKAVQDQAVNQISYGHWGTENAEDLVVVKLNGQELEIHCHGGDAAVERILSDLKSATATQAETSALANQTISFAEEFCVCLQRATTQQTAHHILRQSKLFHEKYEQLLKLSAKERHEEIQQMLAWADFGLHLTQPWKVVLCGPPNVGKSSLINALVGYARAVVYDQPGTTRDVISTQTAFDGWPIEFSDTAGLRQSADTIESTGIERARAKMDEADLLLIVIDGITAPDSIQIELPFANHRKLIVRNKSDLAESTDPQVADINVSALTGEGIDQLGELIVSQLVPNVPDKMQPFPVTQRQVALLRELCD